MVDKEQTRSTWWTSWTKPRQGRIDLKGHSYAVNSLDYQPESTLLASGSFDKKVIVQKLDSPSSPAPLHTLTGHKWSIEEVKFSPSEVHILATWDYSREVRLWDALAGNCLHLFQCDKDGMSSYFWEENNIHFSSDGKLLACRGSEVKVFRVASGQLAAVCKVGGNKVCWNTRGNKLAIATKKSDSDDSDSDSDSDEDEGRIIKYYKGQNILVFDI